MKTKSYHTSNLGKFAGRVESFANALGYVTYHDSDRYSDMSDAELEDLVTNGRYRVVRAAAATELAERAVQAWRADSQDRSKVGTWYTWRTDAASSGMWADSAKAVLAALAAQNEWPEIDSAREAREIADGAWLTIFEDGTPVLRRGQMP